MNPSQVVVDPVPFFVTQPGASDVLLIVAGVFLLALVLGIGVLYFTIHALPEHLARGSFLSAWPTPG